MSGNEVADAWVLYPGDGEGTPAELVREAWDLGPIGDNEVLAQPLYGAWEGNMGHALLRKPIDICRQRGEPKVVLGNAGVVRVLSVGKDVKTVRPGRAAIIFCNGEEDWFGYPKKILGYDAPNTQGCLATRMKLRDRQLIPIPDDTNYDLAQWAAFSLRYVTAWSNWEVAIGTYRLLVSWDELAAINVWGWGGGVTFAELDLARRFGCRATMLSSHKDRLELIRAHRIEAVDRRRHLDLSFDEKRYRSDDEYRAAYQNAENAFIEEVRTRTDGRMVQIFVDMIGAPVFRATLRALAREGVVTTAGWKEGMRLTTMRAIECIQRHQHVHTHYARFPQGWKAVAFAEANGWLPPVDDRIYTFDEIPKLAHDYREGKTGWFPVFSICPE